MNKHQEQGKELLEKLTEIYDKLDQLERSLDTNLKEQRKKMVDLEKNKFSRLDKKMLELERKLQQFNVEKRKSPPLALQLEFS